MSHCIRPTRDFHHGLLVEKRDVDSAIRIPADTSLESASEAIPFRSPGRPRRKPLVRYKSFRSQAERWPTPADGAWALEERTLKKSGWVGQPLVYKNADLGGPNGNLW